ncbi:cytochrome P450 3A2-like [Actinia tenebrosa]|uniref:Cytochrome P450 3A2-like n=1 Tax=Actinia tenebrosa TaxID=6105 RepID=A0A6P8H991_ACTTE|nr:cytochrome P450 3A2-like [Actinia tenebrosa]
MAFFNTLLVFLTANWFAISLTVCISFILYIWGIAPFRRSRVLALVGDLPGPAPLPFLGNLLDLIKLKGQTHLYIDEYYKKYGRLFTMFLFTKRPSLFIGDPEMTKEILVKEFQSFHDRPLFFEIPKPFDVMMSIATGETWHRIRTTISPTFSAHKMKLMIPLMNKSCDLLEKKLDQVAGTGETIDIYKYHQGLTMEGILSTFFGIESNAQNDYNDPAFKAARESLDPGPFRRFITAFVGILPFGSYFVRYFPSFFIGQFQNLVHLTEKIIEARKKEGDSARKDVLDLMLSATQPDVAEQKTLSEYEVIAQSMIFLFAGYETTSITLALTCHHLATNQDFQEKLQKEIDDVWRDEDQPPSYEVVQSLPYLDMVISETLRLYPPGFFLARECTKDCVIKGLHIKKGTPVITPAYSIHRDPEFYPDPEKFDPERFSAEAKASRDPYAYLPFGQGPRNCIGMRFAQMEMKLALVRILKRFTLVVAPETKIPPVIVAKPSILGCDGVKLRVQQRK